MNENVRKSKFIVSDTNVETHRNIGLNADWSVSAYKIGDLYILDTEDGEDEYIVLRHALNIDEQGRHGGNMPLITKFEGTFEECVVYADSVRCIDELSELSRMIATLRSILSMDESKEVIYSLMWLQDHARKCLRDLQWIVKEDQKTLEVSND